MSTTTHHHLLAPSSNCEHAVCVECPQITVNIDQPRGRKDGTAILLLTRRAGRSLPFVGQPVLASDDLGRQWIGHVTSVVDRQWHAHIRPMVEQAEIDRWLATSFAERATLAHLRGWDHFGPMCALCKAGS